MPPIALALAGLAVTVGSALAPSTAPETRIVAARDPSGDVRLVGHSHDLTLAQKQSIDIRALKVDDLGTKVRFTAKLKRITTSHEFDQMVFLRLVPRRGTAWQADIGVSPQKPKYGYATIYFADGDYENCEPVPMRVIRPKQVAVTVPNRCLPTHEARIRMQTLTGLFRTDAPTYSKDALTVPGAHRLR